MGAPNVVLIVSDDQRWDSMGAMPNVQRLLAQHGITYTNAYVTTPVCCPSRASILTGRYARNTGVLDNYGPTGGAPVFDDGDTIATRLHSVGYHTALVGKYMNGYDALPACYIPPGWTDWHAISGDAALSYYDMTLSENGRLNSYGAGPADYQGTVLTDIATDWLATVPEPFFLYFTPSNPHRPALAAPEDTGSYEGVEPWRPESFDEEDTSDKPWDGLVPKMGPVDLKLADRMNQRMKESLQTLDGMVADIVATLEERGVIDNTVVIFTSDNGWMLGEHRLVSKTWPYEESIRVPMVVRTPRSEEPSVNDNLVLNIDLAPTIQGWAGASGDTDGFPLTSAGWPPGAWPFEIPPRPRGDFVVEWLGAERDDPEVPPRYSALHTKRYAYIEYENGWRELYDLKSDPLQMTNLADEPGSAMLVGVLARTLHARLAGDQDIVVP